MINKTMERKDKFKENKKDTYLNIKPDENDRDINQNKRQKRCNKDCICTVMTDKVVRNLRLFDAVDFDGFNYRKNFDLLRSIHTKDVHVTWPDGHVTIGIDKHIEDLNNFFVLSKNTNIKYHFLTIGSENYSAQLSLLQGTVSDSNNPIIPGARMGNKFSIRFSTFNHWNDYGSFPVEKLIWDNFTFVQQCKDPNQPHTFDTPDFLPTSLSDSANPHTATYFKVPYNKQIVVRNLENVKKFYNLVNGCHPCEISYMLHETMSFVRPNGIFGSTKQNFLKFLATLELSATVPFKLNNYIWTIPEQLFGSHDWTVANGFIQVFANNTHTVNPNISPIIFPDIGISPIPMISYIRWHNDKISEIHLLWDNLTIINQLGLTPKFQQSQQSQ